MIFNCPKCNNKFVVEANATSIHCPQCNSVFNLKMSPPPKEVKKDPAPASTIPVDTPEEPVTKTVPADVPLPPAPDYAQPAHQKDTTPSDNSQQPPQDAAYQQLQQQIAEQQQMLETLRQQLQQQNSQQQTPPPPVEQPVYEQQQFQPTPDVQQDAAFQAGAAYQASAGYHQGYYPSGQSYKIVGIIPSLSIIKNWKLFFKNFTNFEGRSRRAEYGKIILMNILIAMGLLLILLLGYLLDGALPREEHSYYTSYSGWTYYSYRSVIATQITGLFDVVVYGLYTLACVVPSISLAVRRCHDLGWSGGWVFLLFVPFVNVFFMIAILFSDGKPFPNQWGASPKYKTEPDAPQVPY